MNTTIIETMGKIERISRGEKIEITPRDAENIWKMKFEYQDKVSRRNMQIKDLQERLYQKALNETADIIIAKKHAGKTIKYQ